MQYNIFENGSGVDGTTSSSGMIVTGFIYLRADPVDRLEATTKQYVDLLVSTIRSSIITSGIFNKTRLPAFVGQVTSETGSNVLTLPSLGIVEGNYSKITVGTNGFINTVSDLTLNDIPNLNWHKIISGKPTTLEGYGITNGINRVNGEVDGVLTTYQHPIDSKEVATKLYVDNKILDHQNYFPGDLIVGAYENPPTGFLRCNGGEVSKNLYPELHELLTGKFGNKTEVGSGKPWKQQYDFNEEQTIDISDWGLSGSLPITLSSTQVVVTKNRVYLLGGWNGTNAVDSVYTATVDGEGVVGVWELGNSLPVPIYLSQAVVIRSKVYLLGGDDGNGSVSTTLIAPINEDGTLGTWEYGSNLPVGLSCSQAFCTRNRVYLLGGYATDVTPNIFSAKINEDDSLGVWEIYGDLPISLRQSQVAVAKNRVYLLGGDNNGLTSSILSTYIRTDGGLEEWSVSGNLPTSLSNSQVIITRNRLYVLGGIDLAGAVTTVFIVPINADGSLGTWVTGSELPSTIRNSQVMSVKNRIYLLGGIDNNEVSSSVYSASFFGGDSDYSIYYTESIGEISSSDNFLLPDFTSKDDISGNVYVKY